MASLFLLSRLRFSHWSVIEEGPWAILNLPLIGVWVAILRVPYRVLYPAILVFIALGVHSINKHSFDIMMAMAGVFGYALSVPRFEVAPLLLGFVLDPLMEEHLRRALLLARGDPMVFVQRPISLGPLLARVLIVVWTTVSALRRSARRAAESAA